VADEVDRRRCEVIEEGLDVGDELGHPVGAPAGGARPR
jgi:hypothetical protein